MDGANKEYNLKIYLFNYFTSISNYSKSLWCSL